MLLITPHTVVGICLIGWFIHQLLVMGFGVNIPGTIMGEHQSTSSKGGTSYSVSIRYAYQGQLITTKVGTDQDSYYAAQARTSAPNYLSGPIRTTVRIFPLTPTWDVQQVPDNKQVLKTLGTTFLIAAFWNGVVGLIWWQVLVAPKVYQKILRNGDYVKGVITGKSISRGKSTSYYLQYSYTPEGSVWRPSNEIKKSTSVQFSVYEQFNEGDSITVFYDPSKRKSSYAYEPGAYEFV